MTYVVGGANTYSKRRFPDAARNLKAVRADGPRVICDDGREYVDAVAALGPILLGHGWPAIQTAAHKQSWRGVSLSLPTEIEETLAERLVSMTPGMEMCRFGKNGNDVVNTAVRIARAVTGRVMVLRNGYHGHADWCIEEPTAGGVLAPNIAARHTVRDMEAIRYFVREMRPAAVVIDPNPAHDPTEGPPYDFAEVRRLCDEHGALLILDEMVTGFRLGQPGAVTTYGIDCDLWCGAKALGGGWPITALLGKRPYMERLEKDVFYSTTFAGESVSIAAALASLSEMERVKAWEAVAGLGKQIRDFYAAAAEAFGLSGMTRTVGYDARPVFRWTDNQAEAAFLEAVNRGGMLFQGYINVMVSHRDAMPEIERALTMGLEAACAVSHTLAA